MSDPFVLGGIAVVMAGLVLWAFWPRREQPETPKTAPRHGRHSGNVAVSSAATAETGSAGEPLPDHPAAGSTPVPAPASAESDIEVVRLAGGLAGWSGSGAVK